MFELGAFFGAAVTLFCINRALASDFKAMKRHGDFWYEQYVKKDNELWEIKKRLIDDGEGWKH